MRIIKLQNDFQQALGRAFVKLNMNEFIIERVILSQDLRHAKICVYSLRGKTLDLLNNNVKKISKETQEYISLKYWPKIHFIEDPHAQRITKINEIIKKIENEV